MKKENSWKEEAWENLLSEIWDKRPDGADTVEYNKSHLDPILSKYTKSGQGEIRIFHSSSKGMDALKKRGLIKIPISRSSWKIIKSPPKIDFIEPKIGGVFNPINKPTEGMIMGIKETMVTSSNPGETTLLSIANYIGIISDFYGLEKIGILFTGGRQRAGVHFFVGENDVDMTKAQIEIDGGFEWPDNIVIVEMKSSFNQKDFDINQALIPLLKWENILKNKKVHSLVMLAETNKIGIEYWAYDFVHDKTKSNIGMKIAKSKKYIIEIK